MNAQNIIPRLRVGVGDSDGSTGLCGMQVISWENGDTEITDMPSCADPLLANIVQGVNDRYCTHDGDSDLLCAPCSVEVLALAHRTVGTALTGWSDADRARLYVTLAVEQAESVLHLVDDDRPRAACHLVRRYLAGEPVTKDDLDAATRADYRAAAFIERVSGADASDAAYVAWAAARAACGAAAGSANVAAALAAEVAVRGIVGTDRATVAHALIDRFEALTGITTTPPAPKTTARAYTRMTA